jgi:hypothetical protein
MPLLPSTRPAHLAATLDKKFAATLTIFLRLQIPGDYTGCFTYNVWFDRFYLTGPEPIIDY